MITVFCVNNKGQRFDKIFNDYREARIFILRCKHGHRVHVEGYATYNTEYHLELSRLLNYGY